jgi:hypothetical protein
MSHDFKFYKQTQLFVDTIKTKQNRIVKVLFHVSIWLQLKRQK